MSFPRSGPRSRNAKPRTGGIRPVGAVRRESLPSRDSLRGAEAPLFHGCSGVRAASFVQERKFKVKVEGNGQECPFHTARFDDGERRADSSLRRRWRSASCRNDWRIRCKISVRFLLRERRWCCETPPVAYACFCPDGLLVWVR